MPMTQISMTYSVTKNRSTHERNNVTNHDAKRTIVTIEPLEKLRDIERLSANAFEKEERSTRSLALVLEELWTVAGSHPTTRHIPGKLHQAVQRCT